MGKTLLQEGAISHNRTGEVGQILFTKKGQRDLTQPFSQRNTPHAAFRISGKVGSVILDVSGKQNKTDTHHTANSIKRNFFAGNTAV